MIELIFYVVGVLILVSFLLKGMVIVRPTERGVIERLGKYACFAYKERNKT